MTPTALRAEAEKVALKFASEWWRYAANVSLLTDALVVFAEKHALRVGARERLDGRVEQAERDYDTCVKQPAKAPFYISNDLHGVRAELAALRDKETG